MSEETFPESERPEATQPPATTKPKARRKRRWLVVLGVFGVLLLGGLGWAITYTEDLLGNLLVQLVERETKGAYELSYSEINYDLLGRRLHIADLQLGPNPTLPPSAGPLPPVTFEAKAPSLVIEIKSLWEVYLRKELRILAVDFDRPTIAVHNKRSGKPKPLQLSVETGRLYTAVADYLKLFKINNFTLNHAHFSYDDRQGETLNQYAIQDLSFRIKDFLLDSASQLAEDRIFYTDAIELAIGSETLTLPDGVHRLEFDSLALSTQTNNLEIYGLNVQQLPDSLRRVRKNALNTYSLAIPAMKFRGMDFQKAYNDNSLHVDFIALEAPVFSMGERGQLRERVPDSVSNSLPALLTKVFDSWTVDSIRLDSGRVGIAFYGPQGTERLKAEQASFLLTAFQLDTNATKNPNFRYYEHARFAVASIRHQLSDGLHALSLNNLLISTREGRLQAANLRMRPNYRANERLVERGKGAPYLFDVRIPRIRLDGFDIERLVYDRELALQGLSVRRPSLRITQYPGAPQPPGQKGDSLDLLNLYPAVSPYLKKMSVGRLALMKGTLAVDRWDSLTTNLFDLGGFDVAGRSFLLDERSHLRKGRLLHTRQLQLEVNDLASKVSHGTELLTVAQLSANTNTRQLQVHDLKLRPIPGLADSLRATRHTLLALDSLQFTGIDLPNALYAQRYHTDSLWLALDTLVLDDYGGGVALPGADSSRTLMRRWLKGLSMGHGQLAVNHLGLVRDSLEVFTLDSLQSHGDSVVLDSAAWTNGDLRWHIHDWVLNAGAYQVALSQDSAHHFRGQRAYFCLADSVFELNELVLQRPAQGQQEGYYHLRVPRVRLGHAQLWNLFTQRQLEAGLLEVATPTLQWQASPGPSKGAAFPLPEDWPTTISKVLPVVRLDTLRIARAHTHAVVPGSTGPRVIAADSLDLTLTKVYLDAYSAHVPERFLFANDVALAVEGFATYPQQGGDTLSLAAAQLSTGQQRLTVAGFRWSNQYQTPHEPDNTIWQLYAPLIRLTDFDWYKAYATGQVHAGAAFISQPVVRNESYRNKRRPFQLPDSLAIALPGLQSLAFDTLAVDNADITVDVYRPDKHTPFQFKQLDLGFDSVLWADSLNGQRSRLLFAHDVVAEIPNYRWLLRDSLHIIRAGRTRFLLSDSTILIKDLEYRPLTDRFSYAFEYGHRKTWNVYGSRTMQVTGVVWEDLFFHQKLKAREAVGLNFYLRTFRDNRTLPFPENYYPPTFPEFVKAIPLPLELERFKIHDGRITVDVFEGEARQPGHLEFNKLEVTARPFTNDTTLWHPDSVMVVDVSTRVENEVDAEAQFNYYLGDRTGYHTYKGTLQPVDLTTFNPMMEHVAFIKVNQGKSKRLTFEAAANDRQAIGTMFFEYNDLSISVLDKEKLAEADSLARDSVVAVSIFSSWIANAFVVISKNPRWNILRRGNMYYVRDSTKSMFNYMANTLLTGVVSSIGARNIKRQIRRARRDAKRALREEDKALNSQSPIRFLQLRPLLER